MLAKLLPLVGAITLALAPASASAPRPWPGELAVVSGGHLVLLGPGGSSHVVNGPGAPSGPAWSPDGGWVAFLRGGSALWATRSNGTDAHRVSPAGAAVDEFSWAPSKSGEMLAFSVSYGSGGTDKIFLASAATTSMSAIGTYGNLIGFSVAPSGDDLAVSYRTGEPPAGAEAPTWKGVLRIVPVAGGPGRVVYTLPAGGYVMLSPGWWPDGKGLLFWDDPAGSASIAADGLTLDSLDLTTGKVSPLATMLTYRNWISWSPGGSELALVAGPNRIIWDNAKHLVLCKMPAAQCRPVPLPRRGSMALGPAWTPPGPLVYDVALGAASPAALLPPGVKTIGNGPFDLATVDEWYSGMRLYVSSSSEATGHPLAGAPEGAHDPVATPQGLFFVDGARLWWLANGASHPQVVAGGLEGPGYYGAGNYYGYIAWYEEIAWHS